MADVHANAQRNDGGGGRNPGPGARADSLAAVRERLFHTLFYRITLMYARSCPVSVRRLIEMMILAKAVFCFCILIYIHLAFARHPVKCLEEIKDSWPRDGVLRVEIIRGPPKGYGIEASYEKERQIQAINKNQEELSLLFGVFDPRFIYDTFLTDSDGIGDELSNLTLADEKARKGTLETYQDENEEYFASGQHFFTKEKKSSKTWPNIERNALRFANEKQGPSLKDLAEIYGENVTRIVNQIEDELGGTKTEVTELEKVKGVVWPDEEYIVEYSLEYGFLRLSPATRKKLNITVKILVLDPSTNQCFGDSFSQFVLQHFLGYDDVLMSSIKSLAEHEDNKGFLRNVVTGAHYHFVSRFTYSSAYIVAAMVMVIFTVVISMLLRYSQHQIFVFIVDLLQMLEFNTAITFPAAPLLTVILALVGMEAIMSEFFEDSTTAFYIIVIVWIADQYDAICCHTRITKRYWLRFFYLYHFSFYAYHYRFSGQYSTLALVTMWLFTQHSMFYFFHHYELPVILQRAQIQELLMRNQDGAGPPLRIGHHAAARIVTNGVLNNNNNANIPDQNPDRLAAGRDDGVVGRIRNLRLLPFRLEALVRGRRQHQQPRNIAASADPPSAQDGEGLRHRSRNSTGSPPSALNSDNNPETLMSGTSANSTFYEEVSNSEPRAEERHELLSQVASDLREASVVLQSALNLSSQTGDPST